MLRKPLFRSAVLICAGSDPLSSNPSALGILLYLVSSEVPPIAEAHRQSAISSNSRRLPRICFALATLCLGPDLLEPQFAWAMQFRSDFIPYVVVSAAYCPVLAGLRTAPDGLQVKSWVAGPSPAMTQMEIHRLSVSWHSIGDKSPSRKNRLEKIIRRKKSSGENHPEEKLSGESMRGKLSGGKLIQAATMIVQWPPLENC